MKICPHCGGDFRYNLVVERKSKTKYLRAGCCDSPLRECPDLNKLLRSPALTAEEKNYLQRISKLDWFSGQIVGVLLEIEAKTQASVAEVAA